MNKILLHIPHSSKKVPKLFWDNVFQDEKVINDFIKEIADTDTDILFADNSYEKVIFPYSRVFCDVEKFDNDDLEIMSKFGMGAVYLKTNLGVNFRRYDKRYNDQVLSEYYYPYHATLNDKIENMIRSGESVVLIDCHSFSKNIIMIEENKKDLPEICIGTNDEEDKLGKFCVQFFKDLGYKVKNNYPYSGSIIPSNFINKHISKFKSIMIEINKDIYLNNEKAFIRLRKDINDLLKIIENLNIDQY